MDGNVGNSFPFQAKWELFFFSHNMGKDSKFEVKLSKVLKDFMISVYYSWFWTRRPHNETVNVGRPNLCVYQPHMLSLFFSFSGHFSFNLKGIKFNFKGINFILK